MRRDVAGRWLGVLLLGAGPVVDADEGPPPLAGPTLAAPAPKPANDRSPLELPSSGAFAPPAPAERRPMLVIPGVNVPGRVRARSVPLPPLEPAGTAPADDTAPRLFGPAAAVPPATSASPLPAPIPVPGPSATPRPTVMLEMAPEPPARPRPPRTNPANPVTGSAIRPDLEENPRSGPTAPRRSPSRFGRFLPPPFAAARAGREPSSIRVEPSTDPAAEAALKRRIERQIHDGLGDRIQDVDVRVKGREVIIRGKATRFWQRRTVRRALESMPGLSGYHPTVELID